MRRCVITNDLATIDEPTVLCMCTTTTLSSQPSREGADESYRQS